MGRECTAAKHERVEHTATGRGEMVGGKAPKSIRPRIQPFLGNSMRNTMEGQVEDAMRKELGVFPDEWGHQALRGSL